MLRALHGATILLAIAFTQGCSARQTPRPTRALAYVEAIRLEGNHSIGSATLLGGLALTRVRDQGQEFDPYLVTRDAERLRGYYLRHGYFRVHVLSHVDQHERRVVVTYWIDEGPRAHLARVEMAGLPADQLGARAELRALIPLADGEPFFYGAYELARPKLIAALESAGYAYARLEGKVAADVIRDEAIIRLDFRPGPLCHFGRVELHGVGGELAEAARARLEARTGARYSSAALLATQMALYDMGRFASVRVEPDRSSGSAIVPVSIHVVEAPPHELRVGGGVGVNPVNLEMRGRAMYRLSGWPRDLTTTTFELRPAYVILRDGGASEPRIEAIAALERMDLLVPRLRGGIEVSFAYLAVEAYTSVGPRVRLGLRLPIDGRRLELGAGWQMRVLDFSRIDPALDAEAQAALGLEAPYLLGFFEQNVFFDRRDDPVEPHRGLHAQLKLEEGTRAAGGEFDYLRATPELRMYLPLGRLVLAGRGRFGAIYGDLPVTQRYFAGGASSQRGFPDRQLAPTVGRVIDNSFHTVVVGGGGLLETGVELRAPLGTAWHLDLGGVAFLDGADVTERPASLDPGNLHWAAGAGLRLATPVGPVRIDVGYRLTRYGPGEPRPGERMAYHLSLGEAF